MRTCSRDWTLFSSSDKCFLAVGWEIAGGSHHLKLAFKFRQDGLVYFSFNFSARVNAVVRHVGVTLIVWSFHGFDGNLELFTKPLKFGETFNPKLCLPWDGPLLKSLLSLFQP